MSTPHDLNPRPQLTSSESNRRGLEASVMLIGWACVLSAAAALATPLMGQLTGDHWTAPTIAQLSIIITIVGAYAVYFFRGRPQLGDFIGRTIASIAGIFLTLLIPIIWAALLGRG